MGAGDGGKIDEKMDAVRQNQGFLPEEAFYDLSSVGKRRIIK
jgi:hypothetical protein